MPNILSTLISKRKVQKTLFASMFQLKRFPSLNNFQKHIHTTKSEFTDNESRIAGVYHHTISAEQSDTNPIKIAEVISNIIKSHTNSLFFLTQKSRLLRRNTENPNNYLPLASDELTNISLMIELIKKQWLQPEGGHTCMAITDEQGFIIKDSEVSLRPDLSKKTILSGRTILHRDLYKSAPGQVRAARHSLINEEVVKLAHEIIRDKTITADITIISISLSQVNILDIFDNIKSVKAIELYNLCSSIVKKEDIARIDDIKIRSYIEELKIRASKSKSLQQITKPESEVILAALACTHAIAKACYGYLDGVDDEAKKSDQATQTAVVYCTMAIIGTKKFMDFAKQINFYDKASHLTK
jgi:hypothetical protein